jgi:hypothetical protein
LIEISSSLDNSKHADGNTQGGDGAMLGGMAKNHHSSTKFLFNKRVLAQLIESDKVYKDYEPENQDSSELLV